MPLRWSGTTRRAQLLGQRVHGPVQLHRLRPEHPAIPDLPTRRIRTLPSATTLVTPINTKRFGHGLELAVEQYDRRQPASAPTTPTPTPRKTTYIRCWARPGTCSTLIGCFRERPPQRAHRLYNRSHFYNGIDRLSAFNQTTRNVSASIGWKFNDMVSISLDGMNLTNEKLKLPRRTPTDQPRHLHLTAARYYFNVRLS